MKKRKVDDKGKQCPVTELNTRTNLSFTCMMPILMPIIN